MAEELIDHPLFKEALAYQGMKEELERHHRGCWVIVHGGERVGVTYESYDEAAQAAQELGLDVLTCYIRQVGVDAVILTYAT